MSTQVKQAYTPGPWALRDDSGMAWGQARIAYALWGANDRCVAMLQFGDFSPSSDKIPVAQNDARLIAAAPEMLEALERIIRNGTTFTLTQFDLDAAKAAIRKAKGE